MTIHGSLINERKKIQGFIFNWKGHEANASALETEIGKLIDVTVINSEEQLSHSHAGWAHLDDSAYFSAQWNKAVELFEGEIFFHIQADAEFDQFDALMRKAELLFREYKLGVYEPNLNYTDITYDRSKLRPVGSELYEIPFSDCTCWFIDGGIVRKLPPVDISINRYGWGIPRAIAVLCRMDGRLCIRDYNFTIKHPKKRGYSSITAMRQLEAYARSLSPELQREILRLLPRKVQLRIGEI